MIDVNKEDADILAAQQAIKKIFQELQINSVVCIDDVYEIDNADAGVELAIGWFSDALQYGKSENCNRLLGKPNFFDVADEEIWKRRLRVYWQNQNQDNKATILDGIAGILDFDINFVRDIGSASLLKSLLPEEIMLHELPPGEWLRNEDTMIDETESLLCLFDHNLQGSQDFTDNSGIQLLIDSINKRGDKPVICSLLTHTVMEGQELRRSGEFAEELGLRRKDFLVLSKDRLSDPMRFAHGLKMMLINFIRNSLTCQIQDIATNSDEQANIALMDIDIYNFDYMVLKSSEEEGVWEAETLFRLFEIFRRLAFREQVFNPENRQILDQDIAIIRSIRRISTVPDENEYPPNQNFETRQIELYEKGDFLNKTHMPLEIGDIFEINKRRFVLIAQPCDLMVRNDGSRSSNLVTLLNITNHPPMNPDSESCHTLDFFEGLGDKAFIKFRSAYPISAEILDMAVFNTDGQCKFNLNQEVPVGLHIAWKKRFEKTKNKFRFHHNNVNNLINGLDRVNLSRASRDLLYKALTSRITSSNLSISLDFEKVPLGIYDFGLRRIRRYRQPSASRLLSSYFAFLSRDASEHDYTGPKFIATGVWKCPDDVKAEYIGSKVSRKFHLYDCQHVNHISRQNRFCCESREDAVNYGMQPCKVCNP